MRLVRQRYQNPDQRRADHDRLGFAQVDGLFGHDQDVGEREHDYSRDAVPARREIERSGSFGGESEPGDKSDGQGRQDGQRGS